MLVIGLTGPSGAGKSAVANLFSSFGLPVIDADRVYHDLLEPPSECLNELVFFFGPSILAIGGRLDRKALGEIVFNDPHALEQLNTITHCYVMKEIRRRMERFRREDQRAAVLDAPQLFEAGAERDCNVIVSVLADKNIRLDRIMARDGISEEAANKRISVQKSDAFFRTHSDYIIENNGNPEAMIPAVRRILTETGVLTD